MQRKESLIEVKVGALVLGAVAILVGMVLILGDFNFNKGFTIYVDFQNAAGLKPGAPVRLAGIPCGSVESVEFLGGIQDPDVSWPVYVRATVWLEESVRESIRTDADFHVTTQGVLGEPYIEIASLDRSLPVIEPGQKFRGTDPARLDQIITSAYAGLEGLRHFIDRLNERVPGEEIRVGDLINHIADLAAHVDERVQTNREEIDRIFVNLDGVLDETRPQIPAIMGNIESATAEADQLGRSLNRALGDGSSLRRTLTNVEEITEVASVEAGPLMQSTRRTMESAQSLLEENSENLTSTISNAEGITDNLLEASTDVETIIGRIEAGEGSLGMLLRDEEIFEDMREFVRELKRRPWRIIWKE